MILIQRSKLQPWYRMAHRHTVSWEIKKLNLGSCQPETCSMWEWSECPGETLVCSTACRHSRRNRQARRGLLGKGWANTYPSAGCERPVLIEALFDKVGKRKDFNDSYFARSHDNCPKNNSFEERAKSCLILRHCKSDQMLRCLSHTVDMVEVP